MSPPVNPNFYYFERPCLICGRGMLISEGDLHKPRIPCARCVKGGTTTFSDAPKIQLTIETEDHNAE